MALIQQCDRCKKTTDNFESVDDPPEGWRTMIVATRGSQGGKTGESSRLICGVCDDDLYDWFYYDAAGNLRADAKS